MNLQGRSAYELPEWQDGERPPDPTPDQDRHEGAESSGERAGNSSGYVQQYDIRGHPANPGSRANARQARRAQNDVLATVGVCISTDKCGRLAPASSTSLANDSAESQKIRQIIRENEFGHWLSMSDDIAFYLLNSWLNCIWGRLQVC